MSRFGDQGFYALTAGDVVRIRGLLEAVDDAISELLEYRCIRPLDPDVSLPKEDRVFEQTNDIRRGFQPKLDEIF